MYVCFEKLRCTLQVIVQYLSKVINNLTQSMFLEGQKLGRDERSGGVLKEMMLFPSNGILWRGHYFPFKISAMNKG